MRIDQGPSALRWLTEVSTPLVTRCAENRSQYCTIYGEQHPLCMIDQHTLLSKLAEADAAAVQVVCIPTVLGAHRFATK